MTAASLYERLGGAFPIAAVVDHFSDAVVRNPITGQGSKDQVLISAWRRPIGRSRSLPRSSTNSWLSLGDRSTTSTCRRRRKGRYSLPSPPTKAR